METQYNDLEPNKRFDFEREIKVKPVKKKDWQFLKNKDIEKQHLRDEYFTLVSQCHKQLTIDF